MAQNQTTTLLTYDHPFVKKGEVRLHSISHPVLIILISLQ